MGKITRKQLNEARFQGPHVYGYFKAFCDLNDSCDGCNRLVRLLCRLRNKIEILQIKIILHVCKEDDNGRPNRNHAEIL